MNTAYYKNHDGLSSLNTKLISLSLFTLIRSGLKLKDQNLTLESSHCERSLIFRFYLPSPTQVWFLILRVLVSISSFAPAAMGSMDYFITETPHAGRHCIVTVQMWSLPLLFHCHSQLIWKDTDQNLRLMSASFEAATVDLPTPMAANN